MTSAFVLMDKPNPATERLLKLINYLTGVLTAPTCPIDASDFGHSRLVPIPTVPQ
jgi:hypothetical protein